MADLILPLNMLINVSLEYEPKLLGRDSFNRLLIVGDTINARETATGIYTSIDGVKLDYGVEAPEYLIAKNYFQQIPKPRDLMIGTVSDAITPLAAIEDIAEQTMGFYGFCFADEVAAADIQGIAEWAQTNNRMFMTVMNVMADAISTGTALKDLSQYHYFITYHEDYNTVGGFAGFALDQRFDRTDGLKTLHLKSLVSIPSSDITQTQAANLKAAHINYYSDYGNPDNSLPIFANGHAGGGLFFDFVMGFDWLRNVIETNVFNGMRLRRLTPQTSRGMVMIVADIAKGFEEVKTVGLVAAGRWNGAALGEVETYDYLPEGYYIYHDPIEDQPQVIRQTRQAPPISALAKGAGAIHGADIIITPQA